MAVAIELVPEALMERIPGDTPMALSEAAEITGLNPSTLRRAIERRRLRSRKSAGVHIILWRDLVDYLASRRSWSYKGSEEMRAYLSAIAERLEAGEK